MGIAGQFRHPRVVEAIQAVANAARKHGKVLGVGGTSSDDDALFYIRMGSRFITSGNDHSFMVSGSISPMDLSHCVFSFLPCPTPCLFTSLEVV